MGRSAWTGQPGEVSLNRSARKGQMGLISQVRRDRSDGKVGLNRSDGRGQMGRSAYKGQSKQDM
jgi:hypothetical protein